MHLEKDSLKITTVCQKANNLLESLDDQKLPRNTLLQVMQEMVHLDYEAAQWRNKPEWAFRTAARLELTGDPEVIAKLPEMLHLYPDLWMAYEWNYHRTARIILHQQLLACLRRVWDALPLDETTEAQAQDEKLLSLERLSLRIIRTLADDVLSSAPQFFGDVSSLGHCTTNAPNSQAIGAYFLLWPIKIIKAPTGMTTEDQKDAAHSIFERIRECTGMKSSLGSLSII